MSTLLINSVLYCNFADTGEDLGGDGEPEEAAGTAPL